MFFGFDQTKCQYLHKIMHFQNIIPYFIFFLISVRYHEGANLRNMKSKSYLSNLHNQTLYHIKSNNTGPSNYFSFFENALKKNY